MLSQMRKKKSIKKISFKHIFHLPVFIFTVMTYFSGCKIQIMDKEFTKHIKAIQGNSKAFSFLSPSLLNMRTGEMVAELLCVCIFLLTLLSLIVQLRDGCRLPMHKKRGKWEQLTENSCRSCAGKMCRRCSKFTLQV